MKRSVIYRLIAEHKRLAPSTADGCRVCQIARDVLFTIGTHDAGNISAQLRTSACSAISVLMSHVDEFRPVCACSSVSPCEQCLNYDALMLGAAAVSNELFAAAPRSV